MNDSSKIKHFLQLNSAVIADLVEAILKSTSWQIQRKGQGLDTVFSIKVDDKETVFYLQNLLMEIATIDRDENPLRFDEQLNDFKYFIKKTVCLIQSKLTILFELLGRDDLEQAIDNIEQHSDHYQRISILRLDQKPTE